MKKQTYLHIQEPCHEDWGSMTAEAQGRFCQSCVKTVTDFSAMTDTQVLKFLSEGSANTCGRFTSGQLVRQIHIPATPAKKTFWAYLLSMFLPVLATERLQAQKNAANKPKTEQGTTSKMARPFIGLPMADAPGTDSTRVNDDSTKLAVAGDPFESYKMGLVVMYDKVTTADTMASVVKKTIKNDLFKVYPNPAVKGKKASVQVKKPGRYTLQLLDIESKMIIARNITVTTKGQIVFLDLPSNMTPGSYYIRLVQAGSNSQYVEKVIVK